LVLADLLFSEIVTKELSSLNLVQETIYKDLERVSRTVAEKDFVAAPTEYTIDTNEGKSVFRSAMDSLRNSKK
jgi:hypothetical protein